MAVREIRVTPDPVLREICPPLDPEDPGLSDLIQDLEDTLETLKGCVGIAAPQIGALHRVVLVDASRYRKPVPNHGRLVLVDPIIHASSGSATGREGCLSLPDYTANITRATRVEVEYRAFDDRGVLIPRRLEATGFEAVVVQHEMDHLEGILFLDRVRCLKSDLFRRKTYQ